MFRKWFGSAIGKRIPAAGTARRGTRRFRLQIEVLEDRCVPTNIVSPDYSVRRESRVSSAGVNPARQLSF